MLSQEWQALRTSALAAVDIVALIGGTVSLQRQGSNLVGLCPFHQEKTPSFSVSPSKQFFHCFGCRAHGNAIDFVMKRDGVTFVEAIKSLTRGGSAASPLARPPVPVPARREKPDANPELERLAKSFSSAVNPARLQRFAQAIGITAGTLDRLGIGWAGERFCGKCLERRNAWAFPMVDVAGRVAGLRLRFVECGHKSAVRGGHEGLFVPRGIDGVDRLFLCEGPTDTAALVDLGFAAIGRPSCEGARQHVIDLLKARHAAGATVAQLVIVADGDAPGQRGATRLAAQARVYCPIVQVLTPPAEFKDARAWKRGGATAADVERAVWAAPRRQLRVVSSVEGVLK